MNILLSALLSGVVAICATVAIERLGGKWGGILASLPTTIVPASIGFYFASETIVNFEAALFVVPIGMLVNAVFLLLWRSLPPHLPNVTLIVKLLMMTVVALSAWALSALSFLGALEYGLIKESLLGPFCFLIALVLGLWATGNKHAAPKGSKPVSLIMLLSRGVLAALAIGLAVYLSQLGIPLLAGMASVFPAIFLTTMLSVWISQGHAVQSGAVGPMMLGSCSVSAYALISVWSIPSFGVILGPLLSWCLAVLSMSGLSFWWMNR